MTDSPTCSPTDRAAALLARAARAAIPVPELAGRLGQSPESLVRRLREDPRFVVIGPSPFPDLSLLPAAGRAAYEAALREAGLHGEPSVALAEPVEAGPGAPVGLLFRDSVARLLARTAEPGLVSAAERLRAALAALATTPDGPDGRAPSTTPPPDRPRPAPAPPRGRPPPPHPPRYPGSRRE